MRWLIVVAVLMAPGIARAGSVAPTYLEMASVGQKSRSQVVLSNDGRDPMAVEPRVEVMELSEDGKSKTRPSSKDFLVLPTQAVIAPGSAQTFRVQYVGEPNLAESRSFLLTMHQLPVKELSSRAGMQVLVSFGVSINVAASNAVPDLKVVKTEVKDRRVRLTVENPTAHHALLSAADIELSGEGWNKSVPAGGFFNELGSGLVQPRKRRTFVLPVDVPAQVRVVRATVNLRIKK